MRKPHHSLRSRARARGQTLVPTAIALVALASITALAIDVARLAWNATELQDVADIAAHAGAVALLKGGSVVGSAQTAVHSNTFNGQQATIAASEIDVGIYDSVTSTFLVGAVPPNAVRARPHASVPTIMAAMLGSPTSGLAKEAIAAFKPGG